MNQKEFVMETFKEHNNLIKKIFSDENIIEIIESIINDITICFANGGKLILFGCGGSAADAQHIAAEFVNGLDIPAIAITTDSSILTSISNDYSFNDVFSKQINALSNKGDIAIGISTSGNSSSVLYGLETARLRGIKTIFLTSIFFDEYHMLYSNWYFNHIIKVPSKSVPRIQEAHILIGHILWKGVEQNII